MWTRREVLYGLGLAGTGVTLVADVSTAAAATGAATATGAAAATGAATATNATPGEAVNIACFIRYQIDPYKLPEFRKYADTWGHIIPRCGGHLIGYFLPHEGTNDIAWGLIAFESLAAYEAYRTRLKLDPEARENFNMAYSQRLILREERTFLEMVALHPTTEGRGTPQPGSQ